MSSNDQDEKRNFDDSQVNLQRYRIAFGLAAIVFCVGVICYTAYHLPDEIDENVLENAEERLRIALQQEGRALGKLTLEYSYWNESVEQIVYLRDEEWGDENLAKYTERQYGVSGVLAWNRDQETVYESFTSETNPLSSHTRIARSMYQEVFEGNPADPGYAHSYLAHQGQLFVVAAAPFTAYAPTRLNTAEFHGVLYLIRHFDEKIMQQWQVQYALPELRIETEVSGARYADDRNAALPVRDILGAKVASLYWIPPRPGARLRDSLAPWALSVAVVFTIALSTIIVTLRQLVLTARRNIVELDENRRKLFQQAMVDDVSGLYNRNYLIGRLKEEISRLRRSSSSAIFIFLDLDGFKAVNDSLGHAGGDRLLLMVGQRLVSTLREEDLVCRVGGDEFCILLTDLQADNRQQVRDIAKDISEKILDRLSMPFDIDEKEVNIGASAGLVIIPDDTDDIDDILRFGDISMYEAKEQPGSAFIYYSRELLHDVNYRNAVRHKLETAVSRQEIGLHYQPVLDTAAGKIIAFEALARWHSKDLGVVRPSHFISIAKESDTIIRLGQFIVDQSLTDFCVLKRKVGPDIRIQIIVSDRELQHPGFLDYLLGRVKFHGLTPDDVELELTGSNGLGRNEDTGGILENLHGKGIRIALKNFDTGNGSLQILQKFPFSAVKIDDGFTHKIVNEPRVQGIVRAIVQMASSLDMAVIATGVEISEQERELLNLGCHYMQGAYYASPGPLGQFLGTELKSVAKRKDSLRRQSPE